MPISGFTLEGILEGNSCGTGTCKSITHFLPSLCLRNSTSKGDTTRICRAEGWGGGQAAGGTGISGSAAISPEGWEGLTTLASAGRALHSGTLISRPWTCLAL